MSVKIVLEPKVTLLASPLFTMPEHLAVELCGDPEATTDAELLSEFAGRICYMSQANPAQRTTGEYLGNILKQGHGSIMEHSVAVFLLEGISRSCTHELVRHRAGCSYSQLSQRYVDESACEFVVPPAIIRHPDLLNPWVETMRAAQRDYIATSNALFEKYAHIEDRVHRRKTAREAARSVLPNATETKIVMGANLRAWRTVLELRCGEGAEQEIRRLALLILKQLKEVAPNVFEDFEVYGCADGTQAAKPTYHKV